MKSPSHQPLNLILLGDPASGKATQAARLAKRYHCYNFDMGDEVRKPAMRAKYDYAKTTGIGKLTPTAIVRDILHRIIKHTPPAQGIIFNGHPKMIGEAKLAAKWLDEASRHNPLVLYLSIPENEILQRASQRVAYVGGKLMKRDDDSERALKNRRIYYREQVSQTVAFFKKHYAFKKISGMGTEAEVLKKIIATIEAYRKK